MTVKRKFLKKSVYLCYKITKNNPTMSTNYKKKLPPSKKIRYRYHGRECSLCGGELKQKSTGNRNLTNLEYKAALSIQICGCTNEACPNASARLKPVEYLNQIVPESGYGIDVYALIGHLRYSCHQTVSEIHRYFIRELSTYRDRRTSCRKHHQRPKFVYRAKRSQCLCSSSLLYS